MSRPLFFVDSVFNPRIYPGHALAASSTASGTDILALSSGKRIARSGLGGWFASATDTTATLTATFDRLRGFDLLWIDREHNLDGESVSVLISDDGFTTSQTLGPKTVPTYPTPYSHLYDGEIVRTNEGCLLWWLGEQAAHAVRVSIAAMGTGLRPELAGLMLGKSFVPGHAQQKPADFGRWDFQRRPLKRMRRGEITLRAESWEEYAVAYYYLEELYLRGHSMVIVHDDERAENALLGVAPDGLAGFEIPTAQYLPEYSVPYVEPEPALL